MKKVIYDPQKKNKLIFDGYPRTLNQGKNLDILIKKYKQKISCVLSLKVDQAVIIKRILGRQICSKCGLIFNTFFTPATKENHKCEPKYLKNNYPPYKPIKTLFNKIMISATTWHSLRQDWGKY